MKEEELLEALEAQTTRVGVLPVLSMLLDRVSRGVYLEIFSDLCDLVTALTDEAPDIPRKIPEESVTIPSEFIVKQDVPRKISEESVTIPSGIVGVAAHGGA